MGLLQNGPLQPLNRTVTTTKRRHNFSFSRRQQGSSLWDPVKVAGVHRVA